MWGARLHQDSVERNHSNTNFNMEEGKLNYVEESFNITKENKDTAESVSS